MGWGDGFGAAMAVAARVARVKAAMDLANMFRKCSKGGFGSISEVYRLCWREGAVLLIGVMPVTIVREQIGDTKEMYLGTL